MITVAAGPTARATPPTDRPRNTEETRIMSEPRFRGNRRPTLGVEVELQLVDSRSMGLRSAIGEVLAGLPAELHDSVKPEFMQCYVEINTGVCRTVDAVEADLAPKVRAVERVADRHGVRLVWAATHPFSRWRDQQITPDDRYYRLAALLQETVVRPVTFGLHVHVGVESGDKAIRIAHRIQRFLPVLLAMSANSPFWHGRATGHHAHRIEVLEGFPTGGMMPALGSWAEFQDLLGQMKAAGFVDSHRELWWDVRPSAENGTIEVRICDMPADLPDLLGLTAMIQCLVQSLSEEIDRGPIGSGAAPAVAPPESLAGLPIRPGGRAGRPIDDGGAAGPRRRRGPDPPARAALGSPRLPPAAPACPGDDRPPDRGGAAAPPLPGDRRPGRGRAPDRRPQSPLRRTRRRG